MRHTKSIIHEGGNMARKWMGVDIERKTAPQFKRFLFEKGIKYEPSENGNLIHFEVFVNSEETSICNDFIGGMF